MAAPVPHNFGSEEVVTALNLNSLTDAINYISDTQTGNLKGLTMGKNSITPVANTATSVTISGLTTPGTNFGVITGPDTGAPGTVVETSADNVSATGFRLWVYRTNTTGTGIWWLHFGWG